MEYFNVYNKAYLDLCHSPVLTKLIRLCILDHFENAIYSITADASMAEGSVTINYQQGVRRTCTLKIRDTNHTYLPTEDSPFWIGRKFKVYIGLANQSDAYWFSQGVFYCQDPSVSNDTISMNGVDKFGAFTEALKMNIIQGSYKIATNANTYYAILDLLSLNMGNGMVIDPIEPYVDNEFYKEKIPYDIAVDEGQYLGDVLAEIATGLAADVYYDVEGHLVLSRNKSEDYNHYPQIWRFEDGDSEWSGTSMKIDYVDVVNSVTVYGTNGEGQVFRYTASNDYASSPIRVSLIGTKACAPIESSSCYDRVHCMQYAAYELRRKALASMSIDCTCSTLPHLDVDKLVIMNHSPFNLHETPMILQTVTLSFGTGENSLSLCNTAFLPNEYESDSYSIQST